MYILHPFRPINIHPYSCYVYPFLSTSIPCPSEFVKVHSCPRNVHNFSSTTILFVLHPHYNPHGYSSVTDVADLGKLHTFSGGHNQKNMDIKPKSWTFYGYDGYVVDVNLEE